MDSFKEDLLHALKKLERDVTIHTNGGQVFACGMLLKLRPKIAEKMDKGVSLVMFESTKIVEAFTDMINYGDEPKWADFSIYDLQSLLSMSDKYEVKTVRDVVSAEMMKRMETVPDILKVLDTCIDEKIKSIALARFTEKFFKGGLRINEMIEYKKTMDDDTAYEILEALMEHQGMLQLGEKETDI
jgi:hypothetical protein